MSVGCILAGYGELEFDLANCVSGVLGTDIEVGFRILFRSKGETARIDVADAILRPFYKAQNLHSTYEAMLGAIRHCKKIRNQYSHCHWIDRDEVVYFVDLEPPVKRETGIPLAFLPVTKGLLEDQEMFFCYCSDLLTYLQKEYDLRLGRLQNHPWRVPTVLEPPALHSPREEYPGPLPDPFRNSLPAIQTKK
jgi:hypothetical protein